MIDNYMNRPIHEVEKPCFFCDGLGLISGEQVNEETGDIKAIDEECYYCDGTGKIIVKE